MGSVAEISAAISRALPTAPRVSPAVSPAVSVAPSHKTRFLKITRSEKVHHRTHVINPPQISFLDHIDLREKWTTYYPMISGPPPPMPAFPYIIVVCLLLLGCLMCFVWCGARLVFVLSWWLQESDLLCWVAFSLDVRMFL